MSALNERKKRIKRLYEDDGTENHRLTIYVAILLILIVVLGFVYLLTTNTVYNFGSSDSEKITDENKAVTKTEDVGEGLNTITNNIENIESLLG